MKPIPNALYALALLAVTVGLITWNARPRQNEAQAAKLKLPLAPEFVGDKTQWLNTNGEPRSLRARRGKVTIVEFFSADNSNFSAIKKWANKWQTRGVEVVGIHTPELEAERNSKSVATFVRDNDLTFPILLDTKRANWNRWKPKQRPAIFVVDAEGRVRFKWEGELQRDGSNGAAQVEQQVEAILEETATPGKIIKTEEQWKRELSPMAFEVLRHSDTEAPRSGALWDNHENGIYLCGGCGLPLFASATKFESGTGWPSFYQPLKKSAVQEKTDSSLLEVRTEVTCARCGGHLGHVFNDGPQPTGLRYCMNSAALTFQKAPQ